MRTQVHTARLVHTADLETDALQRAHDMVNDAFDGDIDTLAQLRPGQQVRLYWSRPPDTPGSAPS